MHTTTIEAAPLFVTKVNITVDARFHSIGPRDAHDLEPNWQRKVIHTLATARTEYSRHGTALFQLNHASRL